VSCSYAPVPEEEVSRRGLAASWRAQARRKLAGDGSSPASRTTTRLTEVWEACDSLPVAEAERLGAGAPQSSRP